MSIYKVKEEQERLSTDNDSQCTLHNYVWGWMANFEQQWWFTDMGFSDGKDVGDWLRAEFAKLLKELRKKVVSVQMSVHNRLATFVNCLRLTSRGWVLAEMQSSSCLAITPDWVEPENKRRLLKQNLSILAQPAYSRNHFWAEMLVKIFFRSLHLYFLFENAFSIHTEGTGSAQVSAKKSVK